MKYFLVLLLCLVFVINIYSLENDEIISFLDDFKNTLLDRNKNGLENFFISNNLNDEIINKLLGRNYFDIEYSVKEINNYDGFYDIKIYLDEKYYTKSGGVFKLKSNREIKLKQINGKDIKIEYTDITKGLPVIVIIIIIIGAFLSTVISVSLFYIFIKKFKQKLKNS